MLTGAHRTGKTTLAKAFSERSGIPFVQTGASQVFAEMGLDPKVDYPMEIRLGIQRKILESFEKQCKSVNGMFITDRTPIDFMAYTLADCQRGNVPVHLHEEIEKYMNDCINLTNWLFPALLVVQPGIKLVEEPGKGPAHTVYVEHINHLIMGIIVSDRIQSEHFYIPRYMTDLEDRINCLSYALKKTGEKYQDYRDKRAKEGNPINFH